MPALSADLQLRQHAAVLPQLIMRSELLGLTTDELESRVRDELLGNPALELDERRQWPRVRLLGDTSRLAMPAISPDIIERVAQPRSLREDLLWQLNLRPCTRLQNLCAYLIHNIGPTGWLETSVEETAAELEISPNDVAEALSVVQGLSPTGVGARNLRECLLLQIAPLDPALVPEGTQAFISEHLETALQGRERTAKSLRLNLDQMDAILEFIRQQLSPYPGLAYQSDDDGETTRPDVILHYESGPAGQDKALCVEVPESLCHALRVNSAYARLESRMRGKSRTNKVACSSASGAEEAHTVREQVREARQFIANIGRRYELLRVVTEAVAAAQSDFIEQGPEYLKPLDKKAIAAALGIHESTVCRATRGKFVQMPDGVVLPFDIFFDDALPLRCLVRYIIAREDPQDPLSDDEITIRLREGGHAIARRTVAKYRTELGIATASKRKK